jgi:hypothetical protein
VERVAVFTPPLIKPMATRPMAWFLTRRASSTAESSLPINLAGCNQFQIGACGQIFELTPHSGVWKIAAEYPTPGFIAPVGDLLVDASGTVFGAACDKT